MKKDGPRPGRSVCVVTQSSGSQEAPSIVLVQAWRSLRRRVRKHPTRRRSEAASRVFRVECERERGDCLWLGPGGCWQEVVNQRRQQQARRKGPPQGQPVSGIDRQTSARSFFLFIVLYRGGTTRGSPASKEIAGIDWVQQQKS